MSIQQWLPLTWSQVIGNYRMVQVAKSIIRTRFKYGGERLPDQALLGLLLHGDSRSGKTATVKLLIRSLMCDELDKTTLDPCGECVGCKKTLLAAQDVGLYGFENKIKHRFEYIPIDCSRIKTQAELEQALYLDIADREVPRIYFLDEVHLLSVRSLGDILLKAIEEKKAIWIFVTARPQNLDVMLCNRLISIETEAPTAEELANWLVDRSNEFGVVLKSEDVFEMVQRFHKTPGKILNELNLLRIMSCE